MGYTHYWDRAAALPASPFAAAVQDCRKALAQAGIVLAGPEGSGNPVFSADQIAFNGSGDHGYESFIIDRRERTRDNKPRVFEFCKTNHRPYDLCVQIALIVFAHHFGDTFLVSSDGEDADWETARRSCDQCLGYGLDFKLTR